MDSPLISRSTGTAPSSTLTQVIPSLPRDSQSSSLLMQLPAELRLIVLRHLLVQSTPIASRKSYEHPYMVHNRGRARDIRGRFVRQTRKAIVSGYHLTPSVISTCQQIFNEALPLLYHCNTLQVHISMDALYRYPYTAEPLHSDGLFDTQHFAARIKVHNGVFFPYRSGGRWVLNEDFVKMARQFKSFLIKIEISNPCTLALVHLRGSLKEITQSLFIKEVEVTILQHPQNPKTHAPKQLFQLTKAFEVMRCSSFRFTNLSDFTAVAVQNVIIGSALVVDLEEFMLHPGWILQKLIHIPASNHAKVKRYRELRSRFVDAIGDFDVNSFLHVRFEILQIWQKFIEGIEAFKLYSKQSSGRVRSSRGEELERYFHSISYPNSEVHINDSAELGLEVYEDGEKMNAKLRDLARLHNFSPIVDADASD